MKIIGISEAKRLFAGKRIATSAGAFTYLPILNLLKACDYVFTTQCRAFNHLRRMGLAQVYMSFNAQCIIPREMVVYHSGMTDKLLGDDAKPDHTVLEEDRNTEVPSDYYWFFHSDMPEHEANREARSEASFIDKYIDWSKWTECLTGDKPFKTHNERPVVPPRFLSAKTRKIALADPEGGALVESGGRVHFRRGIGYVYSGYDEFDLIRLCSYIRQGVKL